MGSIVLMKGNPTMKPKEKPYPPMEEVLLVPVYRSEPDPENPENYPPLEVVGLASISNPLEPLEKVFFVS